MKLFLPTSFCIYQCVWVCACVCVCVCAIVYCKWVLKNRRSHVSHAARLVRTNEGPAPQSEIDISSGTSLGILWIWRGAPRSHGTQGVSPLSSLLSPSSFSLPDNNGIKTGAPGVPPLFSSIFTHSSWILAANSLLHHWMDALLLSLWRIWEMEF